MSDKIFRCMICSAMDSKTMKLRKVVLEIIAHWNQINSSSRAISFVAQGQGINTVPDVDKSAQSVIDKQSVENSHFAILIFNTDKGTSTGKAKTGTLDELNSFLKAKKPVHVFIRATKELEDIKKEIQSLKKVYYETYESANELSSKIRDLLDYTANEYTKHKQDSEIIIVNNAQKAYTLRLEPNANIYTILENSKSGISIAGIKSQTNFSRQKIQSVLNNLETQGLIIKTQTQQPIRTKAFKKQPRASTIKGQRVTTYSVSNFK